MKPVAIVSDCVADDFRAVWSVVESIDEFLVLVSTQGCISDMTTARLRGCGRVLAHDPNYYGTFVPRANGVDVRRIAASCTRRE